MLQASRAWKKASGFCAVPRRTGRSGVSARSPVLLDQLVREHRAQVVVGQLLDLRDLVGGAESVEEVEERDARAKAGGLADQRHVVRFLDRSGGEHREAGLAAGHHVGVVAEDREGVRGHAPRGDVHAVARELARDLVHVGDHQEQALRRREGRRERARLERAVYGPGGPTLGLHLDHVRNGPPYVPPPVGGPLVRPLPHVRGWRDGVDGDDLVRAVGDRRGRLVPIHRDQRSVGHGVPPRQLSDRRRPSGRHSGRTRGATRSAW